MRKVLIGTTFGQAYTLTFGNLGLFARVAAVPFLLIVAISGIKIVQPYQRGLKERLGQYRETLDPGLRLIVPFIDKLMTPARSERVSPSTAKMMGAAAASTPAKPTRRVS